ncbi:TIGR03545 family protein [candidate division KSB1 bacterium]
MRKKGLITLVVIFLLIGLSFYVFTDRFLEAQLESALSKMANAKVEIDGFYFSLFSLKAGWDRMQIADQNNTMLNIIETGKAGLDIGVEPLLFGRWVIEEVRLEKLMSGTERTSDGRLDKPAKVPKSGSGILDKTKEKLTKELSSSSSIDLGSPDKINAKSIVDAVKLQAPQKMEEFSKDIENTYGIWRNEWNKLDDLKNKSNQIMNDVMAIEPAKLRDVESILNTANTLKSIKERADSILNEIKIKKQKFNNDFSSLQLAAGSVDDWISDDINLAVSKAKLPDFSSENIARMLFGAKLISRFQSALNYFNIGMNYAEKLAPTSKIESPPRFKGQNITFPDKRKLPKFWIKKIVISGEAGKPGEETGIILSGTADNITSDQKITGQPTAVNLQGEKLNTQRYEISALLNYLSDIPHDNFKINVSRISLNNTNLGGNDFIPAKILKGNMNIEFNISFISDLIDGRMELTADKVSFEFDTREKENRISKIIRDIWSTVDKVDLNFRFNGKPENLNITLNSNLDDIFAARFRNILSEKIRKGKKEIEDRVKNILGPEKEQLDNLYRNKKGELDQKRKEFEDKINENLKIIETKKKEIEDRLEKEKQKGLDKIKDQLKKKIKDVIKW